MIRAEFPKIALDAEEAPAAVRLCIVTEFAPLLIYPVKNVTDDAMLEKKPSDMVEK